MGKHLTETSVGILMLLGAVALIFLALRVSGLSMSTFNTHNYPVTAVFTDIGSLKVRAPVRIAGVEVGNVTDIELDPATFEAKVTMTIHGDITDIPADTSASITSAGLLGDNYIALTPGYEKQNLTAGSMIETTYPATSIASLISTFMGGSKNNTNTNTATSS